MNNPLISELQQRIRDLERDLRVTRLAGGGGTASGMWQHSVSGSTVTIGAGVVIVDGRGRYAIEERSVTVSAGSSGTPGYIVLRIERANPSTTSTVFQTTEPNVQSTTHWELELARAYRAESGAAVVVTPRTIQGSAILIWGAFT